MNGSSDRSSRTTGGFWNCGGGVAAKSAISKQGGFAVSSSQQANCITRGHRFPDSAWLLKRQLGLSESSSKLSEVADADAETVVVKQLVVAGLCRRLAERRTELAELGNAN